MLQYFLRYLFYTDWGSVSPKIGRCSMDGKNCIILVKSNITWPNAITLDYLNNKIYWADARLDVIYVTDYDGSNRQIIAGGTGQDAIPHPFAMTLYQGFLYVSDWRKQGVYKVDLLNAGKVTMILNNHAQPMDIQMFHASRQNYSKNYCESFGCEQLSLLSYVAPDNCQCACQRGYTLQSDGKSCHRYDEFIIIAAKTEIRGYVFENGAIYDAFVPLIGLTNAVGVTFYPKKEKKLYFTDVTRDVIQRVNLDGSNMEILFNTSLMNPDGIAVDWFANNLYWTDGGMKTISVSKLDGTFRHTLISENLDKPRSIALHLKIG